MSEEGKPGPTPPPTGPGATPGAAGAAAATTGATVLSGGLWHASSLVLPQAYTIVISVVAARFLGPAGMGRQSFISFVEISVAMVFTGGLPLALMRYISETSGRGRSDLVRSLVRWAWRLEIGAALLGGGIVAGLALTRGSLQGAWLLAAVTVTMTVLHTIPSSVLTGLQRWRQATVVGLATGGMGTFAAIVVLAAGGGITGMFAVEAVVSVVNLVWSGRLAQRLLKEESEEESSGTIAPSRALQGAVRRYALIASIDTVLALIVWRRSEFFFLERYGTPEKLALYSISFSAVAAISQLPQALVAVLAPAIGTLFGAGEMSRITSGFGRASRLVLQLTFPLTAAVVALGPPCLRLVYGSDYAGTGDVLVVMMLVFPAIPLIKLSNALMSGLGRQAVPLGAAGVAAVVNISLDLALIPRHGPIGAAAANGLAQLTAGVPVVVYAYRQLGGARVEPARMARAIGASVAAAAAAAWVERQLGGPVGLLTGCALFFAVYGPLAVGLRLLSAEDATWLETTAGGRMGGAVGVACRLLVRPVRRAGEPPPDDGIGEDAGEGGGSENLSG